MLPTLWLTLLELACSRLKRSRKAGTLHVTCRRAEAELTSCEVWHKAKIALKLGQHHVWKASGCGPRLHGQEAWL